jgi:UDP:flavonoid glycosyltransferase YjiC (YdhE family)
MRLGIVPSVWAYGFGPVATSLAVAEEARERRHDVVVLGGPASLRIAHEHGFETRALPVPSAPAYPRNGVHRLGDVAASMGLADPLFVSEAINVEADAYRELRLDWVFHYYQLTCPVAARVASARVATLVTWPDHGMFRSGLFAGEEPEPDGCALAFAPALQEHGQEGIGDVGELLFDRSDLVFSPTYPEADPLVGRLPGVSYVGHVGWKAVETASVDWLEGWPSTGQTGVLLYAGIGDISLEEFVRSAVVSFAGSEFDVIVAAGPEARDVSSFTHSRSPNVRVEAVVPATSVLERCSALVCHGGTNTLMNGLKHGTPTLAFPGSDPERDYFVGRLEHLGLARRGTRALLTNGGLAGAVRALLAECGQGAPAVGPDGPALAGAAAIVDAMEARHRGTWSQLDR